MCAIHAIPILRQNKHTRIFNFNNSNPYGTKYSRMNQVKFAEDSL